MKPYHYYGNDLQSADIKKDSLKCESRKDSVLKEIQATRSGAFDPSVAQRQMHSFHETLQIRAQHDQMNKSQQRFSKPNKSKEPLKNIGLNQF